MKILLAVLFSAALIWLTGGHSPSQLNKSTQTSTKVQTVQAKLPENKPQATLAVAEEKAPTEPLPVVEPKQLLPHEELMQQAGIPQSDWAATSYIVEHESSWRSTATNASSGAYGLCQALPASKMASIAGDYKTNPVTQLKWCHQYAHARYGGWWGSFAFWRSNKWW